MDLSVCIDQVCQIEKKYLETVQDFKLHKNHAFIELKDIRKLLLQRQISNIPKFFSKEDYLSNFSAKLNQLKNVLQDKELEFNKFLDTINKEELKIFEIYAELTKKEPDVSKITCQNINWFQLMKENSESSIFFLTKLQAYENQISDVILNTIMSLQQISADPQILKNSKQMQNSQIESIQNNVINISEGQNIIIQQVKQLLDYQKQNDQINKFSDEMRILMNQINKDCIEIKELSKTFHEKITSKVQFSSLLEQSDGHIPKTLYSLYPKFRKFIPKFYKDHPNRNNFEFITDSHVKLVTGGWSILYSSTQIITYDVQVFSVKISGLSGQRQAIMIGFSNENFYTSNGYNYSESNSYHIYSNSTSGYGALSSYQSQYIENDQIITVVLDFDNLKGQFLIDEQALNKFQINMQHFPNKKIYPTVQLYSVGNSTCFV